jgi:hypothetical protein
MSARALLVGLAAALLATASASADSGFGAPEMHAASMAAHTTPRPVVRYREEPASPRFRWGIPEAQFPVMEAERKLFGFHFEFVFGGKDTPPRHNLVR